ncbi:MAG: hypothetical protein ACOX9C_02755 [Kiritimatiellia bacterium]|jgi:hypothetical protein
MAKRYRDHDPGRDFPNGIFNRRVRGLVWAFERNLYDTTGKHASIDLYARCIRELASPMPTSAEPSEPRIAKEAEALLRDESSRVFPAGINAQNGETKPSFRPSTLKRIILCSPT